MTNLFQTEATMEVDGKLADVEITATFSLSIVVKADDEAAARTLVRHRFESKFGLVGTTGLLSLDDVTRVGGVVVTARPI